jgi:Trypsin-like peptidase domain
MKRIAIATSLMLWSLCGCEHHAEERRFGGVAILDHSRKSTVLIASTAGNSKGTGFIIGDQLVATCFHVAAAITIKKPNVTFTAYTDLQVTFPTGETVPATLASVPTQADPSPLFNDFAVLKLSRKPSKGYSKVILGMGAEPPQVGDEVVFSGYPLATPGMVTHRGMVSGQNDNGSIFFIQASINKGNSGGAVLNRQGNVVGIVSMREGGISKGLQDLQVYIEKTSAKGSVRIMGVNPLQSTRAIIQTMDQYISTGIGYARSVQFIREYLGTHPELQ